MGKNKIWWLEMQNKITVSFSEGMLQFLKGLKEKIDYRDQLYTKFTEGHRKECDHETYEDLFNRALVDNNIEIIEFIAEKLGWSNRQVFDKAVLKASLQIMEKYKGGDECIVLNSGHVGMLDKELLVVIHGFINRNIKFCFDTDEVQLVNKLIGLDDLEIYKWLLENYPGYKIVQENKRDWYPICDFDAIGYDLTFLSSAVINYTFNLIPSILNTCPIESLVIGNDAFHCSEQIEKYGLSNTDVHLFRIICAIQRNDNIDRNNRMLSTLISIYKIRDGWYHLVKSRSLYIKGFEWSADKLVNPYLIFLIWMGKQKPKGLPKLLLYQKVYPYVF